MRGSLEHDALYQLVRRELLSEDQPVDIDDETYMFGVRTVIDNRLMETLEQDRMCTLRRGWVWVAVRWFGRDSVMASSRRKVIRAP
jgi:hypothetical protein